MSAPEFKPHPHERAILGLLASRKANELLTIARIEPKLRANPDSPSLSRKTIGECMKRLKEELLIEYPRGPKSGAAITAKGRELAEPSDKP